MALFAVSTAFPLAASVRKTGTPSRSLGIADVVIAVLLLAVTMIIANRHRDNVSDNDRLIAFRVSQTVLLVVPVLLIGFFLAGDRIDWHVLIVGLAWRGWLLFYALPYLISATRNAR